MNQNVSERPNKEARSGLGRNQPQVDDLRTPRTNRASPAAEIATPIRSRCGRRDTGASVASRASAEDGEDYHHLAGEDVSPGEVGGHEAADHGTTAMAMAPAAATRP